MTVKTRYRWAPVGAVLLLTGILVSCEQAATPAPTAGPAPPAPAPAPEPAAPPAEPQATCDDLAIRLLDRGAGIHGAIVADTLHMGGATAPVTCSEPASQSVAGWSIPDDWTAQVQQSQYYLIVIRYPGGNRIYVISLRSDGTSCIVDTNDECVAEVSDLPDDFDLSDLPDDVASTIPAGREAPATPPAQPAPPPGGGYTPPVVDPPGGGYTPPVVDPPGGGYTPPVVGSPGGGDRPPGRPISDYPGLASNPHPRDGATGVNAAAPLVSWSAAHLADAYDVYWGSWEFSRYSESGMHIYTPNTEAVLWRQGYPVGTALPNEVTYYWRVDPRNADDIYPRRGDVWSFTTAAAPAATDAPGTAPSWPASAGELSLALFPSADIGPLRVPAPLGNPAPTVTVRGSRFPDMRLSWFRFDAGTRTITGRYGSRNAQDSSPLVLTAVNDFGQASVEIPVTVTCGTSRQSVIDFFSGSTWVRHGNHPDDEWLNRVEFKSSGYQIHFSEHREILWTRPPVTVRYGSRLTVRNYRADQHFPLPTDCLQLRTPHPGFPPSHMLARAQEYLLSWDPEVNEHIRAGGSGAAQGCNGLGGRMASVRREGDSVGLVNQACLPPPPPPPPPPPDAIAPAWPEAAYSFSWVDGQYVEHFLAAPTGTPKPTLSRTGGTMPSGVRLGRKTLSLLDGRKTLLLYGHMDDRLQDCDYSGSFTITAANAAGTADMTVSWEVACRE